MVSHTIVIACASLGSIVFVMFAFICWFFPRAWAKGQASDIAEFQATIDRNRQRDLELNEREAAGLGSESVAEEREDSKRKPPAGPPPGYLPPVTPY